jgi:methyltransferase (TIGR00027 family)
MALFRALESARGADSRLFYDPFAPLFLRGWRKWLYQVSRFHPGRRLVEQLLDQMAPGARAAGIARTKWIDDEVTSCLQSAGQLVLLGAGFDTRAYRLTAAAGALVFELDLPEISTAKQAVLKSTAVPISQRVRFAAIDFNRQSLGEVLAQAGFDRSQAACFIWEGVTNYLSSNAVDHVLRQIRMAAPQSTVLFTYIDRQVLETPARFFGAEKLMARLRSYQEPWTFGLRPPETETYLAARGFRLLQDLSSSEVWQRAGRPPGSMHGYEFYRLASARAE